MSRSRDLSHPWPQGCQRSDTHIIQWFSHCPVSIPPVSHPSIKLLPLLESTVIICTFVSVSIPFNTLCKCVALQIRDMLRITTAFHPSFSLTLWMLMWEFLWQIFRGLRMMTNFPILWQHVASVLSLTRLWWTPLSSVHWIVCNPRQQGMGCFQYKFPRYCPANSPTVFASSAGSIIPFYSGHKV